jgi:uncharacterized Tic20 family protein
MNEENQANQEPPHVAEPVVESAAPVAQVPPVAPSATTPAPAAVDTSMLVLLHLSFLAGLVVPFGGSVIAPLVFWLVKRNQCPVFDQHGKEAVNFQISMAIYLFASSILCFVFVGLFIFPVVCILMLVFSIIAAVKASSGEFYRYPLTIRFIK